MTPVRPAVQEASTVAKAELGTKRIDPETGRKFYDLNKDPIVSPYTGKSYPLSFFEETSVAKVMEKAAAEEEDVAEVDTENPEVELVSLEEADEGANGDDIPDLGDDEVEIDNDDDDTFLEEDEDDDNDGLSDLIGVNDDDDEV
nr:TIGR02300 family protein [Ferranicluibacter rubi]